MKSLFAAALVLLSSNARADFDIPLVGKSGVIDVPGIGPTPVGEGCFLPAETCIRKAKEIVDLKAQVTELKKAPDVAPVAIVVVSIVAFVAGAAVGGFAFAKVCSANPAACK